MSDEIRVLSKSQEKKILNLIKDNIGQIKKGANEVTKQINRSRTMLVIMAADTEPIQIVGHLPLLCDDKGVSYVYVRSCETLGKAVGLERKVVACCFYYEDDRQYEKIKSGVNRFLADVNEITVH